MKYYIAYGSNLNKEQMERRCPGAIPRYKAYLRGWRLMYKGSKTGSYLTIERSEGDCVPVVIWEITDTHEKSLDRYEGFPVFYYKKSFKMPIADGEIEPFAYIMDEERSYGVPSQTYVDVCKEGYSDFGFDTQYLDAAFLDTINSMANR